MRPYSEEQKDSWPYLLFGIHLGHAFLFLYFYPQHRYDTDLIAYFIYFRNWLTQSFTLQTLPFFPVPKPLLLLLLGPLANPSLAFVVSAMVSAGLGSILYILTRDLFGRAVALLFSAFFLLDPFKGILTVESNADLYLSFFLFLAIYFATTRRFLASAFSLLCSALVKPVTLPGALYFIFAPTLTKKHRWLCTLLPFSAVPLTFLTLYFSVGSVENGSQLFHEFTTLRDTTAITPDQVLSFVFWTQLVKTRFSLMAPFGFLGLLLWLTTDRSRLTHPFFLFPLAFLGGYVGLSIFSPYMPFFRFFWPIELWFLAFLAYGIVEGARRISLGQETVQKAAICLLLFFLLDDALRYHFNYRNKFVLRFEEGMAFINDSVHVMEQEKHANETILTSFTFTPWVMWSLRLYDTPQVVLSVEGAALGPHPPQPDWIMYVPTVSANPKALQWVDHLLQAGNYEVRYQRGTSVLFHKTATTAEALSPLTPARSVSAPQHPS